MSDLWRPEKLPTGQSFQHAAVRERPLLDRQPIGPWKAHITVTPITGTSTDVLFAVDGRWPGPDVQPAPGVPTLLSDNYTTADRELATEVAQRAIEALAAGVEPDLHALARVAQRPG